MRNTLWHKWDTIGGWMPTIRIDRWNVLCQLLAAGALFFELSYPFWLFFKRWRVPLALTGLSFHLGTWVMMRISFRTLRNAYVIFFEWQYLGYRLGRWLFNGRATAVVSTGFFTRRAAALMQTFDVLGSVRWRSDSQPRSHGLTLYMNGRAGGHGWSAWCRLAFRVPLLLPVMPVLMIAPLLDRWIDASRNNGDEATGQSAPTRLSLSRSLPRGAWLVRTTVIVGTIIVSLQFATGVIGQEHAWPFACYPTFRTTFGDKRPRLMMRLVGEDGTTREVDPDAWRDVFGNRWNHSLARILEGKNDDLREEQIRAVWEAGLTVDPSLASAERVEFWAQTISLDPARKDAAPVEERLLMTLHPPK